MRIYISIDFFGFVNYCGMLMHVVDKICKRENIKIKLITKMKTIYNLGNPYGRKPARR